MQFVNRSQAQEIFLVCLSKATIWLHGVRVNCSYHFNGISSISLAYQQTSGPTRWRKKKDLHHTYARENFAFLLLLRNY